MSHRAVAQEGHISTGRAHISHNMDETWPGAQGNELGFETYCASLALDPSWVALSLSAVCWLASC
jgi:hypothetical protein